MEKKIEILGKEVRLRYCAATENGFEQLRGKSIYRIDFESQEDLIALVIASLVAAYARTEEEAPITSDDILYECNPADIIKLVKVVMELRAEWYQVPKVIETEEQQGEDKPKN